MELMYQGLFLDSMNTVGFGVCPSCEIMILKVVSDDNGKPVIYDSSILRALKYIALINKLKNPVRLINASFGKFQHSKAISLFLSYLRSEQEVLTIAAAGNENTDKPLYPAALDHVVSVAAINFHGLRAAYSNYGPWVNIFAPGGGRTTNNLASTQENVLSTAPGDQLVYSQGTSVATPVVTGVAGLLLSLNLKYLQMS